MFFHGADQAPPDDRAEAGPMHQEAAGDGLHHHEIHQDEGGGYHSIHTHPDGHQEHADHTDYKEASDHMDSSFGEGGDHGGDEQEDSDMGGGGDHETDAAEDAYRKSCG